MTQLIYAISALGIVALVALSMQRSSGAADQSVYTNEVLTQLVTIGRDIVDDIGRQGLPFDAAVDPEKQPSSATYPYVHSADELTDVSSSEFGGCSSFELCEDIDDFNDMDPPLEGERNGIEYTATIKVQYVDLDDTNVKLSGDGNGNKSFAKEITVTVETNSIQVNGQPISASYSRVMTYPRITNYSY